MQSHLHVQQNCPECGSWEIVQTHEAWVCRQCGVVVGSLFSYEDTSYQDDRETYLRLAAQVNVTSAPAQPTPNILINTRYHKRRVEQLFCTRLDVPNACYRYIPWYTRVHLLATRSDIASWVRKDFTWIMQQQQLVDEGFTKARRYQWMLQWVAIKYRLLKRQPELTLQYDFFQRLEACMRYFENLWTVHAPDTHHYFPRLPWVLYRLASVIDVNFAQNKWWYNMHWGRDLRKIAHTRIDYDLMWRDIKPKLKRAFYR